MPADSLTSPCAASKKVLARSFMWGKLRGQAPEVSGGLGHGSTAGPRLGPFERSLRRPTRAAPLTSNTRRRSLVVLAAAALSFICFSGVADAAGPTDAVVPTSDGSTLDGEGVGSWRWTRASGYGPPTHWDCGHVVDGRCVGYFGFRTAWGWRCDPEANHAWAVLDPKRSFGVAHQWLPLGTWVEIRLVEPESSPGKRPESGRSVLAPVTDRGPYAPWGDDGGFDLQAPLVQAMDWSVELSWYKVRVLDIPRYCPAQGADMPDWQLLMSQMDADDPRTAALFAAATEWLGASLLPQS